MFKFIQSMIGNFAKGRNGHKITRGYFHRTSISGDTALGEGNYFRTHCVVASFYKVIDLAGNIVQTVLASDQEYAVNEQDENLISLSYEFTGLNKTPLTSAQIKAVIADIKADPNTKGIANHRLTLKEIVGHKVSGWANHRDVTLAYPIPFGHMDAISETEITQILKGIK